MIPNAVVREVTANGVTASSQFGISHNDSAHLMTILRDTLYTDKILAVLREYSANAWDAHREIGKGDLPLKITIPTTDDPSLLIQDFGPGLSTDDVLYVYTQYGKSTKRGNDTSVGMLGIGSKSAFAYSDSFTIISCHGGMRRTFVAVLDQSEKGSISLLHEEDCGEETGVTIQIAVKPSDIPQFVTKARKLFQYFSPRPDINIDLPRRAVTDAELSHGTICRNDGSREWLAIMGCIPYRINTDQLVYPNGTPITKDLEDVSGTLNFNIGDVEISASREELKYSDKTKEVLIKKFELLVEEFVVQTLDKLSKGGFTPWERLVKAQILNDMGLSIPDKYKDLVKEEADVKEKMKTFTIEHGGKSSGSIRVSSEARLVIKDDHRKLSGYRLHYYNDYLIKPVDGAKIEDVEKELEEILVKYSLKGINVQKISTIPWFKERWRWSGRTPNKKHHVKTFVYCGPGHVRPRSKAWEIETRTPTDDDVFVLIQDFKAVGLATFDNFYEQDKELAKVFGKILPPIYGYKTTDTKPVDTKKIKGTHYTDWREKFARSLITPKIKGQLVLLSWVALFNSSVQYTKQTVFTEKQYEFLRAQLGKKHPICNILKRYRKGVLTIKNMPRETLACLEGLRLRMNPKATYLGIPNKAVEQVKARYPLLFLGYDFGLSKLWDRDVNVKLWIDYIKLIDKEKP